MVENPYPHLGLKPSSIFHPFVNENPYPHLGLKSSPIFHPIRLRKLCKVIHLNSIPWMAEIYGMKIHPKFIHP